MSTESDPLVLFNADNDAEYIDRETDPDDNAKYIDRETDSGDNAEYGEGFEADESDYGFGFEAESEENSAGEFEVNSAGESEVNSAGESEASGDAFTAEDFEADRKRRAPGAVRIPQREARAQTQGDLSPQEIADRQAEAAPGAEPDSGDEFGEFLALVKNREQKAASARPRSEITAFAVEFEDASASRKSGPTPIKNFYGQREERTAVVSPASGSSRFTGIPPQQSRPLFAPRPKSPHIQGDSQGEQETAIPSAPAGESESLADWRARQPVREQPRYVPANPYKNAAEINPFADGAEKPAANTQSAGSGTKIPNPYAEAEAQTLSPHPYDEYTYTPGAGSIFSCKVESWSRSYSLFADFLRDAKKYYKKTCLRANYIYFFSYRPMYKELSQEQLCWYLFWRSKVRGGEYIKTGLSYIFLYIYEQINLASHEDMLAPAKAYENIVTLWKSYRNEFPRIDKYIAEWLIDFTLIHRLTLDLADIETFLPAVLPQVTLPEMFITEGYYTKPEYMDLMQKTVSAYDYTKSKFRTEKNNAVFDAHIPAILLEVLRSEQFARFTAREPDGDARIKTVRESYSGAVCSFECKKKLTLEYRNIFRNFYFRQFVTDIVRQAENMVREYLGVKSRLGVTSNLAEFAPILESYAKTRLVTEKQRAEAARIAARQSARTAKEAAKSSDAGNAEEDEQKEFNPDISAAAMIEKQSWDTTQTLVTLQERDTAQKPRPVFTQEKPVRIEPANAGQPVLPETSAQAIQAEPPEHTADAEQAAPPPDAGPMPVPRTARAHLVSVDTDNFFDAKKLDEVTRGIQISGLNTSGLKTSDLNTSDLKTSGQELPEAKPAAADTEFGQFISSLTETENIALRSLAQIKSIAFEALCAEFLEKSGFMLESVIDNINEKAMDNIGDIIFDSTALEIIDEYRTEVLSALEK